jgi:hypothetical protein
MRPSSLLTVITALAIVAGCSGSDTPVGGDGDAGSRGSGSPCTSDLGCDIGLICVDRACAEPAAEGEPCALDDACRSGLECRDDTCTAVGALDEPCDRALACDAGFLCDGTLCRATVQARLCHCIYTSTTFSPVLVEMQIGESILGPSNPDTCSPCVSVPQGTAVPYVIRRVENGAILDEGAMSIAADPAEIGIAFSAGTFAVGALGCDQVRTGFCGP